ncbi:MAG: dihydroorotate dehydrogenase electron transfer subunit [Ethanoligenens sp.]
MMTISAVPCPVLSKENSAAGVYDVWVSAPQAETAKAGQFVGIRCGGFTLRRPISICEIDRERGRLRLVFEERGEGTHWLAGVRVGESMDILAPLGNGFNLGSTDRSAVFVGGGIGVPPLLEAAKPFAGHADAILGFRSKTNVILQADFERQGVGVTVVTQDGTEGETGVVTPFLEKRLDTAPCEVIFACGPRPMLAAVAKVAEERKIPCFVSMEARMACGVGACLSCAIPVRVGSDIENWHVCKNGPVFDASKIVW